MTGEEKIFPVDGQHRVEGIKKALKDNRAYENEQIPVIFIGHKKDDNGMRRARRLFSTLNRYAKPVSMRDIIALDEDDAIAIISRNLIENNPLFENDRILDAKTKAIPESNKTSFTTIITFYECNKELLAYFLTNKDVYDSSGRKVKGKSKIDNYIKFRPNEADLEKYNNLCDTFWSEMAKRVTAIRDYMSSEPNSTPFRNKNGGNILFRPIALIPIIKAIIKIALRTEQTFDKIFDYIDNMPLI